LFGRKTFLINSGCSLIHLLGVKRWISGCGVWARVAIARLTLRSFYWKRGLWLTLVYVCCPGCFWGVGSRGLVLQYFCPVKVTCIWLLFLFCLLVFFPGVTCMGGTFVLFLLLAFVQVSRSYVHAFRLVLTGLHFHNFGFSDSDR